MRGCVLAAGLWEAMGRIKAIRILPEFPLLDRALIGWARLPAASLPTRVIFLLLLADPKLAVCPFLLSPFLVVMFSGCPTGTRQ